MSGTELVTEELGEREGKKKSLEGSSGSETILNDTTAVLRISQSEP